MTSREARCRNTGSFPFQTERTAGRGLAARPTAVLERLLPLIRAIADERMTYGYRRVCAVLNRRLRAQGLPRVNPKRVYRIMRLQGMFLTRYTGKRPQRDHEGKVLVLRRNLRWSSDVFEFSCDSSETVRVAFALDCRDREVIGHLAGTGRISGRMIRDLMLAPTASSGFPTTAPASRPRRG